MSKHEFNVFGLPTHELPLFREKTGRDWVDYGYDNAYGDYLRDLYLGSAIQSAVVNGVSEMIYGEGLDATDREDKPGQWMKTQRLFENSDEDILRQLSFDLKLYGQCYVQVIWNRVRTEVAELRFLPAHTVRSGIADAQGKVDCYYVSPDWSRMREPRYAPVKYPAWDTEDRTEPASVYQIKAYQPGIFYYGLPDYVGSTNYIELDREVSTFHLNNIKNGLFPSMLLSFNNGVPSDEERRAIERHVNDKFSGSSNAGRLLISFNDGSDSAPQLTPVNPNDNDGMYEFLATECTTKILAGHRITSPLLFGIRGEGNGFGNNADELRDSFSLFQNTVVNPFQRTLLDGLNPLFAVNGIDLDFYFKTLKPADFIDVAAVRAQGQDEQEKEGVEGAPIVPKDIDPAAVDSEIAESAAEAEASYNGAQISAALDILVKVKEGILTPRQAVLFLVQFLNFEEADAQALFEGQVSLFSLASDELQDAVADLLIDLGEDEDDEYELIDEREVDYDREEAFDALWAFARVPSSNPAGKSNQDGNVIKVRYAYAPATSNDKSREFCRKMVSAGKVYRKEDIMGASRRAVNPGWGPGGANTYDLWLYKGGGSCRHFWQRRTYLKKNNKRVSANQAKKLIQQAGPQEPRLPINDPKVAQRPRDMVNRGFLEPKDFTTPR